MENINNEFTFEIPEGYHQASEEELKTRYVSNNPNRVAYLNEDGLSMIIFTWSKAIWLFLRLADLKSTAKKLQAETARAYQGKDYAFKGYVHDVINGIKMEGNAFTYTSQTGPKNAVTYVFKGSHDLYAVSLYLQENKGSSKEEIQQILANFAKK